MAVKMCTRSKTLNIMVAYFYGFTILYVEEHVHFAHLGQLVFMLLKLYIDFIGSSFPKVGVFANETTSY